MTRKHPNHEDRYTPITPEVMALLTRMRNEHASWRVVAAVSGTRLKVLRNIRSGKRKVISQRLLDRLCTGTEVGSIDEFIWFTPEDLIALGIWEPVQYVEGTKRIKGDEVFEGPNHVQRDKKAEGKQKKKPRKRKRRYHSGWEFPF